MLRGFHLSAAWTLLVLSSCGANEANEARLFLDRYDAIDVPDLAERRRRVDALRALQFESERVRAVQEVCGSMHDALVRAEEASATARELLDRIESGGQETADHRAAMQAALDGSANALADSREKRSDCLGKIAQLRTRYRSRRRH